MSHKYWSLPTKLLHLGLVGTVSLQLFSSLVMDEPDERESLIGSALFDVHEILGLTALVVVIVHWAWSLLNHSDGGLPHLFPWFGNQRKQVISDIHQLKELKMPKRGANGGLPGLIHGLGLLAVTGIALTGGALFIYYPEFGEPSGVVEMIEETHEFFATFVWAYWLGHGGIALLHHLSGSSVLRNMFSPFDIEREDDENLENDRHEMENPHFHTIDEDSVLRKVRINSQNSKH